MYVSVGSFSLMAASFLLMPVDFSRHGLAFLNIATGLLFWISLIVGLGAQGTLARIRRKWVELDTSKVRDVL